MVGGTRPRSRWALRFIKKRYDWTGKRIRTKIIQPRFTSRGKELTPPFEPDDFYKRHQKYFITGGTYLWISRLLYEKGPLTRKQIYQEFKARKSQLSATVPIKSSSD